MKRKKSESEFKTITIKRKDAEYLEKIKKKMHLVGIWALVGKLVNTIKELKLDKELK